jgi:hypothetical protein
MCFGDHIVIDAQEPADAGALQLEVAGGAVVLMEVYDILFEVAEDPDQHVEEVHADVGGDAAGFADVSLPGGVVPVAARGQVSKVDIVYLVRRSRSTRFFSSPSRWGGGAVAGWYVDLAGLSLLRSLPGRRCSRG